MPYDEKNLDKMKILFGDDTFNPNNLTMPQLNLNHLRIFLNIFVHARPLLPVTNSDYSLFFLLLASTNTSSLFLFPLSFAFFATRHFCRAHY